MRPLAPSVADRQSGRRCRHRSGSGKDGRVTKGTCWRRSRRRLGAGRRSISRRPAVQVRAPSPADDAARERAREDDALRQTTRAAEGGAEHRAMLTDSNEVDMSHIMAMRAQYKDVFEKKHAARLFHGLFTKVASSVKGHSAVTPRSTHRSI